MQRKRGFNLIEAAIVLGVVGLVLGGIWVAASAVQTNLRRSEASKALLQIVQNVRNLYANQSPATATTINSEMISARAVPSDFVSGTTLLNPWNGAVNVALSGAGPADTVEVRYAAMPREVCVDLTSKNTGSGGLIGLTRLLIDNGSSTVTVTSFPYPPTQAATDCLTTNTVTWAFSLR